MSEESIKQISKICDEVKATLIERNKQYGDSFRHPINIFARMSALDSMLGMIDIKLSRLKQGTKAVNQRDTVIDVMGYCALLLILMDEEKDK